MKILYIKMQTFICMGLVAAASACIFWQLEPDSGGEIKYGKEPKLEVS